jgi:malonyl-CoA decarboxylase
MRLAAHYLALEKRSGNGNSAAVGALDPVANFHCRNGASLFGVHWAADLSAKGLAASCGVMVNYLYDLGQIAHNSEAYAATGNVHCSSMEVLALLSRQEEGA